jgi:hypothetical protein
MSSFKHEPLKCLRSSLCLDSSGLIFPQGLRQNKGLYLYSRCTCLRNFLLINYMLYSRKSEGEPVHLSNDPVQMIQVTRHGQRLVY